GRVVRGPLRGQGGSGEGARDRRPLHLEGDRDRGPPEARGAALRADGGVGRAGRRGTDRPVDDALARARSRDLPRRGRLMFEPLFTAEEMGAAEAGQDVEETMARAGRGVTEE